MIGSLVVVLTSAMVSAACADAVVYPDWTIPVPEGIAVREYDLASLDARDGDRIELVQDLAIGRPGEGGEAAFYRARNLMVDDDGRIYVLDTGNYRVQVFDEAGSLLHSFGGQGQGPGEFMRPEWFARVGDSIIVYDPPTGRFSAWSPTGEHLGDHSLDTRFRPRVVLGWGDRLIAGFAEELEDGSARNITAEFSPEGSELRRLADVPVRGRVRISPGPEISSAFAEGYNSVSVEMDGAVPPRFALGRNGAVYLAAGDEYQLLALDASAAPRWALRTSLPMPAFPVDRIDDRVARAKRASSRSDFDWDELLPAIDSIRVDGHGHLWVFPTVPGTGFGEPGPGAAPRLRPVDVYGNDGRLLFSGMVDAYPWHVARGDFLYRLGLDAETEEQAVFRYVVREPFEP